MLHYPSIENHHNSKNLIYWVDKKPELKTINMVATQKYDGSNLGIEFTLDNKINYYTRNTQIGENDNFCGLKEVIQQDKYASMLDTIKNWKIAHPDIETINLFGEFYGPGIQKRIDYGPEKQIKFFDVYFNRVIQSPLKMKLWIEEMKLDDFLVETLLTGKLDELISSLDKCQELVKHKIEGIVIKPLDEVISNDDGDRFCLKVKVSGFDDVVQPKADTKKKVNKTTEATRNLASYITENRIQDCKGKQPWTNVDDLINRVIEDAFDDYKKTTLSQDSSKIVEDLTPTERKNLPKKAKNLCQNLFNLNSGELL